MSNILGAPHNNNNMKFSSRQFSLGHIVEGFFIAWVGSLHVFENLGVCHPLILGNIEYFTYSMGDIFT